MSAVDVTTTQMGLPDLDEDQLKSRSVGDLGSLSQKSLTWKDERGKQGRVGEGEEEERKREGRGGDAANRFEEDAPGNLDHDISITQSQGEPLSGAEVLVQLISLHTLPPAVISNLVPSTSGPEHPRHSPHPRHQGRKGTVCVLV